MSFTLHFVRHATYGLVGQALGGRAAGLSLDAAGREQASCLAASLAGHPIDAVVSSPQSRALETAAQVAATHGLDVIVDRGFDEIDFGIWTGRSFDDLRPSPEWHVFNAMRSLSEIPGGEAAIAVQARAVAAMMRLAGERMGQEVVVVSHADVIKSVLATVLGSPLDLARRMEIDPASRSVVRLFGDDARVLAMNLPPG